MPRRLPRLQDAYSAIEIFNKLKSTKYRLIKIEIGASDFIRCL